jgi:hypothetical protein
MPALAMADMVHFHGDMSPKSEIPPKSTDGKGSVDATLDTSTKTLSYTVDYSGLSGPATMAHLHGPADTTQNAPVMVAMQPPLTSPIKGTATLTDEQMSALMAGRLYANVHTAANPGGELRGQLIKQ